MNRDELLLAKRARERALGKERRDARRRKDARRVPGYGPICLNPHEMDKRAPASPTKEDRRKLRALENTGGRGETIEWVRAKDCECKPGRDAKGKRRMCTHGRTRYRTMAPNRKKYDGPTHWVSPTAEDSCAGERLDPKTRIAQGTRALSWTDMVNHGIVVEK